MEHQLNLDMTTNFMQQQPQRVAALLEIQNPQSTAELLSELSLEVILSTLNCMLPNYTARLYGYLSQTLFTLILTHLDNTMTTAILRQLTPKTRELVVATLPLKQQTQCRLILSYSSDVVGAWMQSKPLLLPDTCDTNEAIARIKNVEDEFLTEQLYVVNRQRHILGRISVFKLLTAKDNIALTSLMDKTAPPISGRASLDIIQDNVNWQSEYILPVINQAHEIIGVLEYTALLAGTRHYDLITSEDKARPVSAVLDTYSELLITFTQGLAHLKFNEIEQKEKH